jgi:hypothetical protein
MEYNSQKELLIIPEYGRNMQGLIRNGLNIEDREERQRYIERLINLMQQMHPQSRNVEDSKIKLWQHVIRIAQKDLDIDYPAGLSPEVVSKTPETINYPEEINKYRHYGKNVRTMIAKAAAMEDGSVRDGFIKTIAGYMKMAYRNWHKELNVSDEVIKRDLKTISNGILVMGEEETIEVSNSTMKKRSTNNNSGYSNSYGRRDNNRSRKSNSSNYGRRDNNRTNRRR